MAIDLAAQQTACQTLLSNQHGLCLASNDENHLAQISYAPYLHQDDCFYVYLSNLAQHTQNMIRNPQVSIMILQNPDDAANPFVRQRLSFQCTAAEIHPHAADYDRILQAMSERLGKTISLLRQLPDFRLFRLRALHGQFIAGFGQAFPLDACGQLAASQPTSL